MVHPVVRIMAGSIASAAVATVAVDAAAAKAIWLGMLAPLIVVTATWRMIERVSKRHPERVTAVMMTAFGGKLVFFGAYVGLAIGVLRVQPVPFVLSFTAYFVALQLIEALFIKRLFVS